ncbi:putative harbinger transposase-derived nuclease [Abeliophyllum distichum]|uniref:Harbinger transposase-derived nuclease n=1 Tax=Abeliophyllum distichum TaxID=126358 RepID=A0ABD1PQK3_9LAMI
MAAACRNVQHRSWQRLKPQSIEESLVSNAKRVSTTVRNTTLNGGSAVNILGLHSGDKRKCLSGSGRGNKKLDVLSVLSESVEKLANVDNELIATHLKVNSGPSSFDECMDKLQSFGLLEGNKICYDSMTNESEEEMFIDAQAIDESNSDSDSSDEEALINLERDTLTWLMYCRTAVSIVSAYIERSRTRIHMFPNSRNGHVFMIQTLEEDPYIAFCEFRMYPSMFVNFTHVLHEEYELLSSHDLDIYEQVGMFLFILVHGKGYRQVRTVFGHYLQTIHHYFNVVLRALVRLGAKIIKPKPNYNESPTNHRPEPSRHPYFQDCIGAIDGTHVKAVLPANERLHFIDRKGYPPQNILAACDFNISFTFVLPGTTGNVHDSQILARAIHSPEINFPLPATSKYYLVNSGFAHRPGYMAPYKGADIRYHFQEFPHVSNDERRRFRNVQKRVNFNHSSLRNVIERACGVLKKRWKILDRMPNYSFRKQTPVVVATMAVHNFLRRAGQVDRAFQAVDEVVDAVEIDFPDEPEETVANTFAPGNPNTEWDQLRDHIAQMMR